MYRILYILCCNINTVHAADKQPVTGQNYPMLACPAGKLLVLMQLNNNTTCKECTTSYMYICSSCMQPFCNISLVGFSVPAFGILISLSLEVILVQCASCSEKFRYEFGQAGGLKYLQLQLYNASNEEFNKVSGFLGWSCSFYCNVHLVTPTSKVVYLTACLSQQTENLLHC